MDSDQELSDTEVSMTHSRSKRSRPVKSTNKFAELKKARARGDDDGKDDERIYDTVDEATYQKIVKKRFDEEDFVVDDDGQGYLDTGYDEMDDEDDYQSGSDGEGMAGGAKNGKKRGRKDQGGAKMPVKKINQFFVANAKQFSDSVGPKAKADAKADAGDDSFLQNLLKDLDDDPLKKRDAEDRPRQPAKKAQKRSLADIALYGNIADANDVYSSAVAAAPPKSQQRPRPIPPKEVVAPKSDLPSFDSDDNDRRRPTLDHDDGGDFDYIPSTSHTGPAVVTMEIDVEAQEDDPHRDGAAPNSENANPNVRVRVAPRADSSLIDELKQKAAEARKLEALRALEVKKLEEAAALAVVEEPVQAVYVAPQHITSESPAVSDGTLRMFWFDAYEQQGVIYLFGKAWNGETQSYVSCCVTVKNIERNLFVLPRETCLADDMVTPTKKNVEILDMYQEFSEIAEKHKISKWLSKPVQRKYAFELPNVPAESTYLKVVYSFAAPQLPSDIKGKTFSRVFGTNTSALELFIKKRKLMGPCWLLIENCKASSPKVSWCKIEVNVENQKSVRIDAQGKDAPPLVVMSLSVKTMMNQKQNVNEIISLSGVVHSAVELDVQTKDPEKSFMHFNAIRPMDGVNFPLSFRDAVVQRKMKLEICKTERQVLSFFMANVMKHDPDIIVGHNFVGFGLDILLHRMKFNKIENWSRIGRMNRSVWPKLQSGAGGTGESTFEERKVMSGRLVCDTYISAKDLIRQTSYSLVNLAKTQLNVDHETIDFDGLVNYFASPEKLAGLAKHSERDSVLAMSLMFKLMVLPLTKQLTTLAGNLWARTLLGARAERNEFLLLHKFHGEKYICPDKSFTKKVIEPVEKDDDDQEQGSKSAKSKKKAAYAGGLVLTPKVGLYDKQILLLDFNSLYPSIIQEFNICFTTVQRESQDPSAEFGEDAGDVAMPERPDSSLKEGILPALLRQLVERRRQVKGFMKDKNATPEQLFAWNIRQQALKLTANSMYGCLGFSFSRFYAKPLAMLITAQGRDILQNTVDLVTQKFNLEVVYGDTDSIMINSQAEDLAAGRKIAQDVIREVNKKYSRLELDIDGVFAKLLLLKKKKYAALVLEENKDGTTKLHRETKGLDLVRRDWCDLSKEISSHVLDLILSEKSREEVVEEIHEYLRSIGAKIRNGEVPIAKFVINKSLTKAPSEYADAKSQPHVQVALRMKAKGLSARAGDTIPYVICQGDSQSPAQRAYHPDDIQKENLKIDLEWYLKQQVHPPVSRLCDPIEGTDISHIADCLGLDGSKFVHSSYQPEQYKKFWSQLTDAERFGSARPFSCICTTCKKSYPVEGVFRESKESLEISLVCPNKDCKASVNPHSLRAQIITAIRQDMEKYYDGWLVCDDSSCHARTRQVSVRARRCLTTGCRGTMQQEYNDSALHTQLCYYEMLYNVDHHLKKLDETKKVKATVLVAPVREAYSVVQQAVKTYLNKSAYRFVDLKSLVKF